MKHHKLQNLDECRNRACFHTFRSDPFLPLKVDNLQNCGNPRNFPSLYDECKMNGGAIVATPSFTYCSCQQKDNSKGK